jgi:DNA-binding transcriptional LysR family regulator
MKDIDIAQVRKLDMSLLVIFAELLRHRKMTAVAAKLGLTQSAISHSVQRLRDLFGDELFLRRANGLEPTARALSLEPKIAAILDLSAEALNLERSFEPSRFQGSVRIAAIDYEESMFAAPLIEMLHAEAPHLRLIFHSLTRRLALDALESGEADVALGYYFDLGDGLEAQEIYSERYSVVARKDHPIFKQALTRKRYAAARHLLVSLAGDLHGIADFMLERHGLSRHVCASVPLFFPALTTIARTELIATIPRRLAMRHANTFGLGIAEPPIDIRAFSVSLVWHRRTTTDPALKWFRTRTAEIVAAEASDTA